ncbi:unnamed protein product [Arabidopsis halleri]
MPSQYFMTLFDKLHVSLFSLSLLVSQDFHELLLNKNRETRGSSLTWLSEFPTSRLFPTFSEVVWLTSPLFLRH